MLSRSGLFLYTKASCQAHAGRAHMATSETVSFNDLQNGPGAPAAGGGQLRNRYLGLRAKILLRLFFARKLTPLKAWNALVCYASYFMRRQYSAKSPIVMNFELWNECNESCVFCRSNENDIYDSNPRGDGRPIPKGKLDLDHYKAVLTETADRLVMAIPYINGEPLMSKDIYAAIKFATDLRVGTLIASNGILLNEQNSKKLLEAGLDCLKVHISGFTTPVHSIQHRRGDVERIKKNLLNFVHLRSKLGAKTIVVLDYILYKHNEHEAELARRFAVSHGLIFNVRPGNPRGMEDTETPQTHGPLPVNTPCDWLWTILSIDWNSSIYPCCDHVVWSGAEAYGTAGHDVVTSIWNGPRARRMRVVHARQGRTPIPICAECPRQGLRFKW